jgi:AraC-like DNA-binding protein
MSDPRTNAGMFEGYAGFASSHGLDFSALREASGLTEADLSDPVNEISLNAAACLLNEAALAASDPCLGLKWAEAMPKASGGVLSYMLLNTKSVRHSAKTIARYVSLYLDPIDVSFTEADSVGNLVWRFPPTFTAPRIQYASFAMASVIIRLRRIAGATWMPMGVELEHRELECADCVRRILGPNVRFNCEANALRIRESVLNREATDSDARLYSIIKNLGDRLLAERATANDIVAETQGAIVVELPSGFVTLEDISECMELTPRVLQTRLATAGTSYETLLQETRQALATGYLRDTDLPVTEIALLLGFSELSAFTRAATRWYGVPPRQHRQQVREASATPSA